LKLCYKTRAHRGAGFVVYIFARKGNSILTKQARQRLPRMTQKPASRPVFITNLNCPDLSGRRNLAEYEVHDELCQRDDYQTYDGVDDGVLCTRNVARLTTGGDVLKAADDNHDH
jgi:hypothetical protein